VAVPAGAAPSCYRPCTPSTLEYPRVRPSTPGSAESAVPV
jgi:hypothetical protein